MTVFSLSQAKVALPLPLLTWNLLVSKQNTLNASAKQYHTGHV